MKGKKVFCIALFFSIFYVFAAELQFYPQAREIPSLSVSSIAQDSQGFLWFATRGGGVIRYAANSHTVYSVVPFEETGLASAQVLCLSIDPYDVLWLGTNAGVSELNCKTGQIRNFNLPGSAATAVLYDSRDRLWVATSTGLFKSEGTDETGRRSGFIAAGFDSAEILRLYEDNLGVFAATSAGLFLYDEYSGCFKHPAFVTPQSPLVKGRITALCRDSASNYWAGVWGLGLVVTETLSGNFEIYPLEDNRISCVSFFGDSLVLAGTAGGGLFAFDSRSKTADTYTSDSPHRHLSGNIVQCLFTDANGLLWVGTHGAGLNTYDSLRSPFTLLEVKNFDFFSSEPVISLAKDSSDFLWTVFSGGAIVKYDAVAKTAVEYRTANGGIPFRALCVYAGQSGAVYAGTSNGLFYYNAAENRFLPVAWYENLAKKKENAAVSAILEDGGRLFAGTRGGGVFSYDFAAAALAEIQIFAEFEKSDAGNYVNFISADSSGLLWIGTNGGLVRYDKTGISRLYRYDPKERDGLMSNAVQCFYEAKDGLLWFGCEGGISVYNPRKERFTSFSAAAGIPPQTITGICELDEGCFLLATNNGLFRFIPDKQNLQTYKMVDGPLSREFTGTPVVFADGSVFLPTTRGILRFEPKQPQNSRVPKPPKTVITDFAVDGISIDYAALRKTAAEVFVLSPDRRNIAVSFTSLDFSPLATPVYKYKLEGFDSDWISAEIREKIQYTNLNPGFYTFKVKNEYPSYKDESEEASISFTIMVPFFRRWYFIVACGIIVSILVYAATRLRYFCSLTGQMQELEQVKDILQTSNKNLEYISNTDALTGVDNRRSFENLIADIWHSSIGERQQIAVLMIDIDYFKSFNDKNGHVAGDSALRSVAFALRKCLENENGIVCRYGGEEFVAVLLDCGYAQAVKIAENMRAQVEKLGIPSARQTDNCLSVSIGTYAGKPSDEISWQVFVDNADQALYTAKKSGRNRVRVFGC